MLFFVESISIIYLGSYTRNMKRALLVGIKDYQVFDANAPTNQIPGNIPPPPADWPRLEGSINDIKAFKHIFLHLGFQIDILLNAQATGNAIRTGFKKIIRETRVIQLVLV